jgi:hypothetical protein
MKGLRRIAFNCLVATSLVLFMLTSACWIRTFFVTDVIHLTRWNESARQFSELKIQSRGDYLWAHVERTTAAPGDDLSAARAFSRLVGFGFRYDKDWPRAFDGLWSWAWWDHYRATPMPGGVNLNRGGVSDCRNLRVRPWLIPPVFLVFPAIRLNSLARRRRRIAAGICTTCGYDLRATPGRCPECGCVPAILPP